MLAKNLIEFEDNIARMYKEGQIRGPIHLRNGNEEQLIEYFDNYFVSGDYVFSTWANHLHALLAGVPPEKITTRILECESMAMNFPSHRFFTSAIVGGIGPIATGLAYGVKKKGLNNRVHVFIGDMAAHTGIIYECMKYSLSHDLPISWIIENNNKSVCTDTTKVWNMDVLPILTMWLSFINTQQPKLCKIHYYEFSSTWEHSGVGAFVNF